MGTAANLLLRDIPQAYHAAARHAVVFLQGVALVVEGENHPCNQDGARRFQVAYPARARLARAFPKAAVHLRGLVRVGWSAQA